MKKRRKAARKPDALKLYREAVAQQAATAEILRVISSSPTDLQPVFDAILKSATRLCDAHLGMLNLREGSGARTVAQRGAKPSFSRWLAERGNFEPGNVLERMFARGRPTQVPDLKETHGYREGKPNTVNIVNLGGARTYLAVPLLKGGDVIGGISIYRPDVRPFTPKQIALVRTFADQAAIAIENVRLFNETKEALEHQKASADILKIVASSVNDVEPVFKAILDSMMQLFRGFDATVWMLEGDKVVPVARGGKTHFPIPQPPLPLSRNYAHGIAILERRALRIEDLATATGISEELRKNLISRARRAILMVPLIREGKAIGAISVSSNAPARFSDKQVALFGNFADQAVIAIENLRLFNETKEALEQQRASAEILRVIAGSPTDVQPVLDAMAESAARLCGAGDVIIRRVDGDMLRIAAHFGPVPVVIEAHPMTRTTVGGRAALERRTVHVEDIVSAASRAEYPEAPALQQAISYHAMLAVPLVRNDVAVGIILLRRLEARLFSNQQVALLESFADQAVIAIENARLFNETKEALERQTATAEILRVIAGSPSDVQPVFDTISRNALRLCGSLYAIVHRFDGELIHYASSHHVSPEQVEIMARGYPRPPDNSRAGGRAILSKSVVCIEDTLADPDYDSPATVSGGWRRILAVPMLLDGDPLGDIVVGWAEPGPISKVLDDDWIVPITLQRRRREINLPLR